MKTSFKLVFVPLAALLLAVGAAAGDDRAQGADVGPQSSSFDARNDHLIVPGQRIGPFALGMSDKNLFKLSIPLATNDGGGFMSYQYEGFIIYVDKNTHTVAAIMQFGDPSYHTAEGVKVGITLQDVEAALGPPDSSQSNPFFGNTTVDVHYNVRTLAIDFTKLGSSMADAPEQSVQTIGIQSPGVNLF